jgi:predicted acetyltransferase
MPLQLQWTDTSDVEGLAQLRLRCYGAAGNQIQKFRDGVTTDSRPARGDVLIARRDGEPVGTATSLSLKMWMRGAPIDTQGVAWVGTVKTARRAGSPGEKGIASIMMADTLRLARERQQPISALMPFRASFYEHFGYGNAEQRVEWTVPMGLLPKGDSAGWRFCRDDDAAALLAARQREVTIGHCDVETSPQALAHWMTYWPEGMVYVRESSPGVLESQVIVTDDRDTTAGTMVVNDWLADSPAAFQRLLGFLGTLKDQYTRLRITLPGDLPLNRLLRESQIPHRQVDHPFATARPFTRMQIRVLDHKRAIEPMKLPLETRGRVHVAVRESEGTVSRFSLEIADGRATVTPTLATPDLECTDVAWASLISGDLPARTAAMLGVVTANRAAVQVLGGFSVGPVPFCQEYW